MSKFKTIDSQVPHTRTERVEYGTLRNVAIEMAKAYEWKGHSVRPGWVKNLKNTGSQLLVKIMEVDASKASNLLEHKVVNINREDSDRIREKSVPFGAVLDLIVIEHDNRGTVEPYPLCVKPTNEQDDSVLDAFAVNTKTESTYSWEDNTEEVSIDDYITLGV